LGARARKLRPHEAGFEYADFRAAAHAAVDWVADYFENIDSFPVLSRVQPGEIASQFAGAASEEGKPYDALLAEFREKILPHKVGWLHIKSTAARQNASCID
jgi:hypothetical protein